MISTFAVLAEPNRRTILSFLASSERSVGEIEHQLRMPQTSVSKHLRVLRDAGFVEARVDAQRRLYRIRPEPLQEVDGWLEPFRRLWTAHVDALERHLDRMDGILPAPAGEAGTGPRSPGEFPVRSRRGRLPGRSGTGRSALKPRSKGKEGDDERI